MNGTSLLRVKNLQPEIIAGWCLRNGAARDFVVAAAAPLNSFGFLVSPILAP
jgi:hypothetical protein